MIFERQQVIFHAPGRSSDAQLCLRRCLQAREGGAIRAALMRRLHISRAALIRAALMRRLHDAPLGRSIVTTTSMRSQCCGAASNDAPQVQPTLVFSIFLFLLHSFFLSLIFFPLPSGGGGGFFLV